MTTLRRIAVVGQGRMGVAVVREAERRGHRVVAVRLVEVDVVGLQALQRGFHLPQNIRLGEPFAGARHIVADLGGNDDLAAAATGLQPVADDGLALAAGYDAEGGLRHRLRRMWRAAVRVLYTGNDHARNGTAGQ